mmetsp:Transcript_7277/g.9056  ORF Transcript_7277/g.9056 Transcript_7277/m.9056 type:complete len:288 (+) Transcript_7277:30-893(+)
MSKRIRKIIGHLKVNETSAVSLDILDGKSALITGSTSGIGLSVAKALANKGCNVVITGFGDWEKAVKMVKSVAKYPSKVYYLNFDLNDVPEQPKLLVKESLKLLGNKIDILVNNAGLQYVSKIEDFPDNKFELLLNVMLHSPFYLTKSVIPHMRKNKFGRIINISSAHGKRASPYKSGYCTAKHGIIGLTRVTALEMGLERDINWTCNAVCPGWTETELAKAQVHTRAKNNKTTYNEEEYKLLSEKHGQVKWVQPNDVASFVEYLCGNNAQQINGASLSIDAGWAAR